MAAESAEQKMRQLVGQSQTDSGTATATGAGTMTDTGKTWTTNQYVGLTATIAGHQLVVTANSNNTLTGSAWTGGTPAAGAYTIAGLLESIEACYSNFHGSTHADLVLEIILNKKLQTDKHGDNGFATAVGATTMTDSSRTTAWTTGEWVGAVVQMNGAKFTVTANTTSVLTGAGWTPATPVVGVYFLGQVEECVEQTVHRGLTEAGTSTGTSGTTLSDNSKNWTANQWLNFTASSGGDTLLITANTSTQLTGSGGWTPGTPGNGAYTIGGAPSFVNPALAEAVEQELLRTGLTGWS